MTTGEMREVAKRGYEVATAMGPGIHWLHSYISGDKVYRVYYAANEELLREHARRVGAPVNVISEIKSIVDVSWVEG